MTCLKCQARQKRPRHQRSCAYIFIPRGTCLLRFIMILVCICSLKWPCEKIWTCLLRIHHDTCQYLQFQMTLWENLKIQVFAKAKLKNCFFSKLPHALVLVCAFVSLQYKSEKYILFYFFTFLFIYLFIFYFIFFRRRKWLKTNSNLKVHFIFKHDILAHIQAWKHTFKTVCCTKDTRHDK